MKFLMFIFFSNLGMAQVQTDIVVNCRAQDKANHIFVVKNQETLKASVHDWDDFLVGYYDVELVEIAPGQLAYQDIESKGVKFSLTEPKNQSGFYVLKAQTNVGGEDYSIGRFNINCIMFTREPSL